MVYVPVGVAGIFALWFTRSAWRAVRVEGHVRIFDNLSVDSDSIFSELRWAWLLVLCVAGLLGGTIGIAKDLEWGSPLFTASSLVCAFTVFAAFFMVPRRRKSTTKRSSVVAVYSPDSADLHENGLRQYNPERNQAARGEVVPLQVTPLRVNRRESQQYLVRPVPRFSMTGIAEEDDAEEGPAADEMGVSHPGAYMVSGNSRPAPPGLMMDFEEDSTAL